MLVPVDPTTGLEAALWIISIVDGERIVQRHGGPPRITGQSSTLFLVDLLTWGQAVVLSVRASNV